MKPIGKRTAGAILFPTFLLLTRHYSLQLSSQCHISPFPSFLLLHEPSYSSHSIQSIGTFTQNHQVLFFACHLEHAVELKNLVSAKNIQMLH
jgi:hypothetical protein